MYVEAIIASNSLVTREELKSLVVLTPAELSEETDLRQD